MPRTRLGRCCSCRSPITRVVASVALALSASAWPPSHLSATTGAVPAWTSDSGPAPRRLAHGSGPPDQRTVADDLIERVGRYVLAYEKRASAVVAEEIYLQEVHDGRQALGRAGIRQGSGLADGVSFEEMRRRTLAERGGRGTRRRELRSDVLLVQLPDRTWYGFRDVIEVDGRPVADRTGRLQDLFLRARQSSQTIVDESARYNIGPVTRNVNLPTFGLSLLHPDFRGRFVFRAGTWREPDGTERDLLSWTEVARPTMVRGDGDIDVPIAGRAWLDRATGAVLRIETVVGGERSPRAQTDVVFAWNETLGLHVPAEMRELYDLPWAPAAAAVECRARYSNFRRFQVATDEQIVVPKKKEWRPQESRDADRSCGAAICVRPVTVP